METIRINDTVELSRVMAGCMRLADAGLQGDGLLKFVEGCMDMGVTTFDHAPVYGGYTCEKIFGDSVLRKCPKLRKRMQIVTKTGIVLKGKKENRTIYYEATKEEIFREMEASLDNLGTDYVDVLLIHRPDFLANPEETGEALDRLVQEGKVRSVGVSNYMPSQIEMLQSYMKTPIAANQVEFSVKSTQNLENGVMDDALLRRIPLMAWSPLGGGSIFYGEEEQSVRLRKVLQEIAKEHDTTMDTVMYGWIFKCPAKIGVVTGTLDIERMKRAVNAVGISLSYDEWYRILEASRGYSVP